MPDCALHLIQLDRVAAMHPLQKQQLPLVPVRANRHIAAQTDRIGRASLIMPMMKI